jgi:hypothetical protein
MNSNAMRIEWDESSLKEIEEAKDLYRKAKSEGRLIETLDGQPVESFRPWLKGIVIREVQLQPTEFAVRILDETGDRRLIWNAADPEQVKEASDIFKKYLEKGWKAYMIDHSGKRGRRIYGFDSETQEVFFDEKSALEKLTSFATKIKSEAPAKKTEKSNSAKLADFVKTFKNVALLPKTYPG